MVTKNVDETFSLRGHSFGKKILESIIRDKKKKQICQAYPES